jgi:hypothetical protein
MAYRGRLAAGTKALAMNRVGMRKRARKLRVVPITPLREKLLRDAYDHGNALSNVGERSGRGVLRAFQILCRGGLLDTSTGQITQQGLEILRGRERQRTI